MSKKTVIAGAVAIIVVIAVVLGLVLTAPQYDDEFKHCQEYIAGTGNIQGSVDTYFYRSLGEEFEIGANQHGYAVFKNPDSAFKKLKTDFSSGIKLIQKEYSLMPLSKRNFTHYGTYGWQVTAGTQEEREQAMFVSSFMDIYENSFEKSR